MRFEKALLSCVEGIERLVANDPLNPLDIKMEALMEPRAGNPGGPITLAKPAHGGPKLMADDTLRTFLCW
ncbi:MAG: hypothetical protein WBB99_11715, partial [Rhodococcus sp. (in: high G+C Gram-positive bacteria)]